MAQKWIADHEKFTDRSTLCRIRYIRGQMSSPTSQIIFHHILLATRVCRPPYPNGILSSMIQTGRALFSIDTTLTTIHMHLISQFACRQSTFQCVKGHNRCIKSQSGDSSSHLGMWWTIVLHISWSTVEHTCLSSKHSKHCILTVSSNWLLHPMMTFFYITGPLWGEFSNAVLWCFIILPTNKLEWEYTGFTLSIRLLVIQSFWICCSVSSTILSRSISYQPTSQGVVYVEFLKKTPKFEFLPIFFFFIT